MPSNPKASNPCRSPECTGKIEGRYRDYLLSDDRIHIMSKSGVLEVSIPVETADREMFEAYLATCQLKVIALDDDDDV